MNIVKILAIFLVIELVLLLMVFTITGVFSVDGTPMKFFSDIAASNGTDVWSIATAMFVVGTIMDAIFMFLLAAFGRRY